MTVRGRNSPRAVTADVSWLSDQRIDIVRHCLVVDQPTHRSAEPQFEVILDLVVARAEAGAPQQVLDHMLAVPYPFSLALGSGRVCCIGRLAPRRESYPCPAGDGTTAV